MKEGPESEDGAEAYQKPKLRHRVLYWCVSTVSTINIQVIPGHSGSPNNVSILVCYWSDYVWVEILDIRMHRQKAVDCSSWILPVDVSVEGAAVVVVG